VCRFPESSTCTRWGPRHTPTTASFLGVDQPSIDNVQWGQASASEELLCKQMPVHWSFRMSRSSWRCVSYSFSSHVDPTVSAQTPRTPEEGKRQGKFHVTKAKPHHSSPLGAGG
jgi:hypothetical protein